MKEAKLTTTKVLIAIPTLNEERNITPVIEALLLEERGDLHVDVIVTDGGSTDATVAKVAMIAARTSRVRLVHNLKKFQSGGVNFASLPVADRYDYLVRCDAHAVYPQNFVSRLVDVAEAQGADSVVVPMDSVGETCFQRAVAWVSDTIVGSGGSRHRGGNYSGWVDHGHHALFRMDRFAELGGYNDTMTHVEDVEYDSRLTAAGGRIYMDSSIRITYFPRTTPRRLFRQYYAYGYGRAMTAMFDPASFRTRQQAIVLHCALLALSLLLVPAFTIALVYPALYVAILVATSVWIALSRSSACGLLAGVATTTMHIGWGLGFASAILTKLITGKGPERLVRPARIIVDKSSHREVGAEKGSVPP